MGLAARVAARWRVTPTPSPVLAIAYRPLTWAAPTPATSGRGDSDGGQKEAADNTKRPRQRWRPQWWTQRGDGGSSGKRAGARRWRRSPTRRGWRRRLEATAVAAGLGNRRMEMAPARRRVPAMCSRSTVLVHLSAAVGGAGACHATPARQRPRQADTRSGRPTVGRAAVTDAAAPGAHWAQRQQAVSSAAADPAGDGRTGVRRPPRCQRRTPGGAPRPA